MLNNREKKLAERYKRLLVISESKVKSDPISAERIYRQSVGIHTAITWLFDDTKEELFFKYVRKLRDNDSRIAF